MICVNKLSEAVAFNKHTRCFHSRERLLDSLLDLIVSCRSASERLMRRRPSSAPCPSRLVSLLATRTHQRLFTQKMTHTTRVRILAAGTIVTASCLDRFPSGKRLQQLTHQRRLPNVGSKPTNTDNNWLVHTRLPAPSLLRSDIRCVDFQNTARVLVETVTNSFTSPPSSSCTRTVKLCLSPCPSTFAGK